MSVFGIVFRALKRAFFAVVSFAAVVALSAAPAFAQQADAPAAPAADAAGNGAGPSLELNKLEPNNSGCRAYMVVNNPTDTAYQSFKLDLVLFQADGVIGKRFALDLAPLKAQKKSVKLFEIEGVACDKIGSFLINDVMECKTDAGASESCLQQLKTSSLTNVQLSK